jgi:uncharacterized protein (DUF1697 family)
VARHAAFLRGINLGKRRVKMDALRTHFEALDVGDPQTFIASGNVVFDHDGSDTARLEDEIERHLHHALGFATETFVRTLEELRRITQVEVVTRLGEEGFTPLVIFLREGPGDEARRALEALESDDDRFAVLEREVVWFRRGRLSDSPILTRHLDAALGRVETTMRNLNTLRRMVEKFGEA